MPVSIDDLVKQLGGGIGDSLDPMQQTNALGLTPSVYTGAPVNINPSQMPASRTRSGGSYWSDFLKSALQSGTGDLIGKPDLLGTAADVESFRAQNPISSITSQLVGAAPTYALGIGAGMAMLRGTAWGKRALDAVRAGGDFAKGAPLTAAAARTALEITPFELARLGVASVAADEGKIDEVALSAGLDIALAPVLPVAWAGFKALRPVRTGLEDLKLRVPELDTSKPFQEQLSVLYGLRQSGNPELKDLVDGAITSLEKHVRLERPKGEEAYVGTLAGGRDAGQVRRLFKIDKSPDESPVIRRGFFVSPKMGFASDAEWGAELARLGFPNDWASFIQFPRQLSFATKAAAQNIQKTVGKELDTFADGWSLGREADTGLYVMAKKYAGAPEAAAQSDRWIVFKTNNPNKVLGRDVLGEATERQAHFLRGVQSSIDRSVLDAMKKEVPGSVVEASRAFRAAIKSRAFLGKMKNNAELFLAMTPEQFRNATKEFGADIGDAFQYLKKYLAPAMHQFRKQPMAEWVRLAAQNVFDDAAAKASLMSYGPQGLKDGESIFRHIFRGTAKDVGGIEGLVMKTLKDEDMQLVSALWKAEASPKDIVEFTRTLDVAQRDRIRAFFEKARLIDEEKMKELMLTQRLYGIEPLEPKPNHYGISHMWRGDWRQEVWGSQGNLLAMASGRTRQEAAAEANKLAAKYNGTLRGAPHRAGFDDDVAVADRLFKPDKPRDPRWNALGRKPYIHEIRADIPGFIGDNVPLLRRELADLMLKNIDKHYKYIAETIVKHDLLPEIVNVKRNYGNEVFDQLLYRINQMAGKKGWFNKVQNETVSRVLGPLLGNNSADKLVSAYNKLEYHASLLALNLGHAGLNALTFVQTMLPKIALIRGAPPERLAEFMGFMPDIGPSGRVNGMLSFLDPIRLASAGMRAVARPTKDEMAFFQRATRDGVVAPRFIEEYIGQNSVVGRSLKDAIDSGKNPVVFYLERLSQYPAAKMEELSRAHAFMTGKLVAERMLGVANPEQIYQFAKQFTFRTMYQYSAADRPKLFAGPMGSLLGLFKNWMFHNIGDMGQYTGEAFLRNNWAPLLWALSGNAALAGIGGLPLYAVADGFYKMANQRSIMDDLYKSYSLDRADAIFYGLPAFLGTSMQSSGSGPFNNPVKDINFMFNAAVLDRSAKIWKFLQAANSQWQAGANPFEYDRTWDLAAYAFAPRTIYKAFSQVEDGALKAIRNGQPIIAGINIDEAALNAIGLTPLKIARAYEASETLWSEREARQAQTLRYGEAFAQAMATQNEKDMAFLLERSVSQGIDLGSVMRSAARRLANQDRPILPFEFRRNPLVAERLENFGLLPQ